MKRSGQTSRRGPATPPEYRVANAAVAATAALYAVWIGASVHARFSRRAAAAQPFSA